MSDPTPPASGRSTLIYFLVTIVIALVGVSLTLWGGSIGADGINAETALVAIGTSMLAGGLAGLGLGVLRALDDRDEESQRGQLRALRATLTGVESTVLDRISNTAADLNRSVRIENSARLRCVSDLEISRRFREDFHRAAQSNPSAGIPVDVVGLKLYRFLLDQLDWMLQQGRNTDIRLLLQNPDTDVFKEICDLENRSSQATARDIANTLSRLQGAAPEGRSLTWRSDSVHVELRFSDAYQPVTLFRVEDIACVRPRVSTPLGAATRFYETYDRRDSDVHFAVYLSHFEKCWDEASYRVPAALPSPAPKPDGS